MRPIIPLKSGGWEIITPDCTPQRLYALREIQGALPEEVDGF